MCEHDGWLYAATAVWAVFLRYAGREERWPKHMRGVFSRENIEKIIHHIGGCDLWRTRDGHRWLPVTSNGFGNYFNIGFRNMVSSPYGLFVGAANPFAPQVAVRRVAGWNYEDNPRGALEIWHGAAPAPGVEQKAEQPGAEKIILRRGSLINDTGEDAAGAAVEKVIADFYGNSGFRHYGFWKIGVKDAGSACENLLDELLAFLPDKKGKIVDVACGQGATTRYLLKHFPRQAVTGVARRKIDMVICRQTAPDMSFLLRDGARLNLPADTFDFAMYVKGLDDPGPRRKLIREIFHTLKAGGRYVSFDLLVDGPVITGLWQKIKTGQGQDDNLKIYRELLEKEGFADIRIFDVTGQCGESFRRHVARYFGLRKISGDIQEEVARQAESRLQPPVPERRCLPVTCVKPGGEDGRLSAS
jgi:SAM-dependent methyltransferase